jgi:hypothetical protein
MNQNIYTIETETDLLYGLLADSSKLKHQSNVIMKKQESQSNNDSFLVEKDIIDSVDKKEFIDEVNDKDIVINSSEKVSRKSSTRSYKSIKNVTKRPSNIIIDKKISNNTEFNNFQSNNLQNNNYKYDK